MQIKRKIILIQLSFAFMEGPEQYYIPPKFFQKFI